MARSLGTTLLPLGMTFTVMPGDQIPKQLQLTLFRREAPERGIGAVFWSPKQGLSSTSRCSLAATCRSASSVASMTWAPELLVVRVVRVVRVLLSSNLIRKTNYKHNHEEEKKTREKKKKKKKKKKKTK
eukprot:Skav227357  [mRNA]  locus=scaffold1121:38693:40252:- [translate_table: standard]